MSLIKITAGQFSFRSKLEIAAAPLTCAKFKTMLPYRQRVIHVRWSGEACWIPMGDLDLGHEYARLGTFADGHARAGWAFDAIA